MMSNAGLRSNIRKSSVAIVLKQAADGRLSRRPLRLQARSIHQKNVQPSVIVVIYKRNATPGSLNQITIGMFATEDRLRVQTSRVRDVRELDSSFCVRKQILQRENS